MLLRPSTDTSAVRQQHLTSLATHQGNGKALNGDHLPERAASRPQLQRRSRHLLVQPVLLPHTVSYRMQSNNNIQFKLICSSLVFGGDGEWRLL